VIQAAAGAGRVDVIKVLLDSGADPNMREGEWIDDDDMLSLATCPSNILAEIHRPARSRLIDSNATKKLINIAFAFGRTEHVPRQRTLAFEQRMELYVE